MEPIPTTGLTSEDVDELSRKTREKMLEELMTLTAEARGIPIKMYSKQAAIPATQPVVAAMAESL